LIDSGLVEDMQRWTDKTAGQFCVNDKKFEKYFVFIFFIEQKNNNN
jgi:hypothetical protein